MLESNANLKIDSTTNDEFSSFHFQLFGDILPAEPPKNVTEALDYFKKAPTYAQNINNGKGMPIVYYLQPINILKRHFGLDTEEEKYSSIDETIAKSIVEFFDDILVKERQINDLTADVREYEKFINNRKIIEFFEWRNECTAKHSQLEKNLKESLIKLRSNEIDSKEMFEKLKEFYSEMKNKLKEKLSKFRSIESEISFLKHMLKLNVSILDTHKTKEEFLSNNYKNDCYILYFNDGYEELNHEVMKTFIFKITCQKMMKSEIVEHFAIARNDVLNETSPDELHSIKFLQYKFGEQFEEVPIIPNPFLGEYINDLSA